MIMQRNCSAYKVNIVVLAIRKNFPLSNSQRQIQKIRLYLMLDLVIIGGAT